MDILDKNDNNKSITKLSENKYSLNILDLPNEILIYIFEYLSDMNKRKIFSICKGFNKFKYSFKLNNFYEISKIINCPYNFTSLVINNNNEIQYLNNFNVERIFLQNKITDKLPNIKALLCNYNDNDIDINIIPKNILNITFPKNFNNEIAQNYFTSLKFVDLRSYNIQLQPHTFPKTLENLFMRKYNKKLISNCIPNNLKKLKLFEFNNYIDYLPYNLTSLYLNSQEIKIEIKLPETLVDLHLPKYKHDIILPKGLIILCIGWENIYNIPKKVKSLNLTNFDKITDNKLPSKLKKLFLKNYKQIIPPNWLPKTLTKLELDNKYNQIFEEDCLPDNIKIFKISNYYNKEVYFLPKNLKELYYNAKSLNLECIPKTLEKLITGYNVENISGNVSLLSSIKVFEIGNYDNNFNTDIISENIEKIKIFIGGYYPQLSKKLPNNIKFLELNSYTDVDKDFYPKNLVKLNLRSNVNINKCLPKNLKYLELYMFYKLEITDLPENLLEIKVFRGYKFIDKLFEITKAKILMY